MFELNFDGYFLEVVVEMFDFSECFVWFSRTSPSCELELNKNRHVYDDEDDKQYNLTANKKNDRTLRALVFPICLLSDSYCVLFVLFHKNPKIHTNFKSLFVQRKRKKTTGKILCAALKNKQGGTPFATMQRNFLAIN